MAPHSRAGPKQKEKRWGAPLLGAAFFLGSLAAFVVSVRRGPPAPLIQDGEPPGDGPETPPAAADVDGLGVFLPTALRSLRY